MPAIYYNRFFSEPGSLISYGEARVEQFRLAAGYIDRILKGAKPADLPVQAPTKFELIINLKTAKALGLTIPDKLMALADEVMTRVFAAVPFVSLWHKADIGTASPNVCFRG